MLACVSLMRVPGGWSWQASDGVDPKAAHRSQLMNGSLTRIWQKRVQIRSKRGGKKTPPAWPSTSSEPAFQNALVQSRHGVHGPGL